MNERIREIAKEAAREMNETGTYSEPKFQEKFALLIVRECAKVANLTEDYDTGDYKSGRQWASFDIKTHFGVEE